jgi:hypothetical protein
MAAELVADTSQSDLPVRSGVRFKTPRAAQDYPPRATSVRRVLTQKDRVDRGNFRPAQEIKYIQHRAADGHVIALDFQRSGGVISVSRSSNLRVMSPTIKPKPTFFETFSEVIAM